MACVAGMVGVEAHVPEGTPKDYCEQITARDGLANHGGSYADMTPAIGKDSFNTQETSTHDFADGAGALAWAGSAADGNTAEDCNPLVLDPVLGIPLPGDFDRHYEWAIGGAFLLARDQPLATTVLDSSGAQVVVVGDGSLKCFGTGADHYEGTFSEPLEIWLHVQGAAPSEALLEWRVAVDWPRPGALNLPCGDGLIERCSPADIPGVTCNTADWSTTFIGTRVTGTVALIDWPSGADGAYHVIVGNADPDKPSAAARGHVTTS